MCRTVEPRIALFKGAIEIKRQLFEIFWGSWSKAFETSLRSSCQFLSYFEVSGCRFYWWPVTEANWESKLVCLFAAWLVSFLGRSFDLVWWFLKRVRVCLLHWQSSIKRSPTKFPKWFYAAFWTASIWRWNPVVAQWRHAPGTQL